MTSENASTPRWPKRYILLWLLLAALVDWWRGPAFRLAFEPNFYPPGFGLFQPDFFQEWWLAPVLCTRRCESRINRYRCVLVPA
jgi:hypothetical protein